MTGMYMNPELDLNVEIIQSEKESDKSGSTKLKITCPETILTGGWTT